MKKKLLAVLVCIAMVAAMIVGCGGIDVMRPGIGYRVYHTRIIGGIRNDHCN